MARRFWGQAETPHTYTAGAMRCGGAPRGRYWLYAAAVAGPLAQLGHVVSYTARYGTAAGAIQSAGVHAYFPTLLKSSAGLLGAAVLTALLLMGGGRLVLGERLGFRRRPGIPIPELMLACLCFQFDVYVLQEVLELLASGQALTAHALASVAVWGLVGQCPVALLAAVALHWLSARLELALTRLRSTRALPALPVPPAAMLVRPQVPFDTGALRQTALAAFATRGPPATGFARAL